MRRAASLGSSESTTNMAFGVHARDKTHTHEHICMTSLPKSHSSACSLLMAGIPRTKLVKDAQLIDRAQIGDSLHARTHAPATLIPFFLAFICLVDTPVDEHASCQFAFFCYEETAPICILRPLAISHYFAPLLIRTCVVAKCHKLPHPQI